MKKNINTIMTVYEKLYNAMFIEHDAKLAATYRNEYTGLCLSNGINPHTNLELKTAIDNFINSKQ